EVDGRLHEVAERHRHGHGRPDDVDLRGAHVADARDVDAHLWDVDVGDEVPDVELEAQVDVPVEPEVLDLDGGGCDQVDGAVGQRPADGVRHRERAQRRRAARGLRPEGRDLRVEQLLGRALVDGGNDL